MQIEPGALVGAQHEYGPDLRFPCWPLQTQLTETNALQILQAFVVIIALKLCDPEPMNIAPCGPAGSVTLVSACCVALREQIHKRKVKLIVRVWQQFIGVS